MPQSLALPWTNRKRSQFLGALWWNPFFLGPLLPTTPEKATLAQHLFVIRKGFGDKKQNLPTVVHSNLPEKRKVEVALLRNPNKQIF
jgi:hypothetical protein